MKTGQKSQKHGKNDQNSAELSANSAENEEELEKMALRIRTKLLRRLEHIADHAPEGLVTEVQNKKDGTSYKLVDLVASYKNVAGKLGQNEGDNSTYGFSIDGENDD